MKNTEYKYRELKWEQVLYGYSVGIFPMGEPDGTIAWYEASPRAIMPIDQNEGGINITRSMRQVLKKNIFEIKVDTDFDSVIKFCGERKSTWINELITDAYTELFNNGYAHSVEAWQGDKLVGGLYGVAYKGAFFGESMFHKVSDASKAAVVKLYEILRENKFVLLDIQMMTSHFKTFGAVEVSKRAYLDILDEAMSVKREFKY